MKIESFEMLEKQKLNAIVLHCNQVHKVLSFRGYTKFVFVLVTVRNSFGNSKKKMGSLVLEKGINLTVTLLMGNKFRFFLQLRRFMPIM